MGSGVRLLTNGRKLLERAASDPGIKHALAQQVAPALTASVLAKPSTTRASGSKPLGTHVPVRNYSTSERTATASSGALASSRRSVFELWAKTQTEYYGAKKSTSLRANYDFVQKKVPALLSMMAKSGVALDMAHVGDLFHMMSYLHLPGRARFETTLANGSTNILGLTGPVAVELVGQHNQRLDLASLASIPWGVMPGTGFHVWNLRSKGKSHNAVVFRGTNSFGPSRDVKLGPTVATGALANGAKDGIGSGVVQSWLAAKDHPLAKLFPKIDLVGGHSLGAALGQELLAERLASGSTDTFGYFGSAPHLSRPHSPAWDRASERIFFVKSAQDPVPLGGSYKYPGREIVSGFGDLPVQPGFVGSSFDGLVTQHGAPISLLKSMRGDTLEFTRRDASPRLDGPQDPESFPLDVLLSEAADLVRPWVTPLAFTPVPLEKVMLDAHDLGLERLFTDGERAGPRGVDYAYFIHLTDRVLASEWVAARYVASPAETMLAIAEARDAIRASPEQGLKALRAKLAGIEPAVHVADDTMKAVRGVFELVKEAAALKA